MFKLQRWNSLRDPCFSPKHVKLVYCFVLTKGDYVEPADTSELVFLLLVSSLVNLSRLLKAHTFEETRKEKRLIKQSAKLDMTAIQDVPVPLKQVY